MIALLGQLPSAAQIRKAIRRLRFGKNLRCPRCRSRSVYAALGRYRCRQCRRPFSLLTGTWLAGTKLDLRTVYALLWCWCNRVPVLQTRQLCHVSLVSVYAWFAQFRAHLPVVEPILTGKVQMDEAYFRTVALVMAKQVGSRQVAHALLPKATVDKRDASQFLFQHVAPRSRLQTDGSGIYRRIDEWWPVSHRKDIHARWEFALTSEIEGLFGNLRTFIRRMYHHVTPDKLPEVVSEFCARFSSPEIFESPLSYLKKTL